MDYLLGFSFGVFFTVVAQWFFENKFRKQLELHGEQSSSISVIEPQKKKRGRPSKKTIESKII